MKHNDQTRKRTIKYVSVDLRKRGDFEYPHPSLRDEEWPEEVWIVTIGSQDGTRSIDHHFLIFESSKEADEFVKDNPAGSAWSPETPPTDHSLARLQSALDKGVAPVFAGDPALGLPWVVLMEAGISSDDCFDTSQLVLDYLGNERVQEIKAQHGENWMVVAEFEYCWRELSQSSPAFIAAACKFKWFISRDDFGAGYLLRDLEIVAGGAENLVANIKQTRKRAGVGGGTESGLSRDKRIVDLLEKIEAVAARNPDMVKLGARGVASIAVTDCVVGNPSLWVQGAGQVTEYLGVIRRGEAGPEAQARYVALFPSKPLKRSGQFRAAT